MTVRTRRHKVTFNSPFLLEAAGREIPAGTYEVVTDEELIEGLSFPVYRRVATMMTVPGPASSSATEMLTVDPSDLTVALERDGSAALGAAPPAR
jgi:hypothetical protein